MALSNIFREPRREITETVIGLVVVVLILVGPLAIAWHVANAIVAQDPTTPFPAAMVGVVFLEIVVVIAVAGLTFLIHTIGEGICNALARRGVELRPRFRQ